MCLMVYLGSDVPLPSIPWSEDAPKFNVSELKDDHTGVEKQFSKPHVYYAGSHQGCGCGFLVGEAAGDGSTSSVDSLEDTAAAAESSRQLVGYVSRALELQPVVEVFACWAGDEKNKPERRHSCRAAELPGRIPDSLGGSAFIVVSRG